MRFERLNVHRLLGAALAGFLAAAGPFRPLQADAPPLRDVVVVGNSASGTVSFLDGHTYQNLGSVNVIPDIEQRLAEINADPIRAAAYALIRQNQRLRHFEPANGDRFVDDVVVSPDGTTLYVSRGNLGDAAAFDLVSPGHPMRWRRRVSGFKADHAGLSPDGSRLVVSATTAMRADVFDAQTGAIVGGFGTGSFPHANDFSRDGRFVYDSSIGNVTLPFLLSALKGPRQITVADARTFRILRVYPFRAGVRPLVFTPDERTAYVQLSYLNGFVRFDLASGRITRRVSLPYSQFARDNYPTFDDYPHNSAHHGIALSADGLRVCSAGTIDNNVALVSTATLTAERIVPAGLLPYWSTTSHDGTACIVTISGDREILVLNYATGAEVARVPVGRYPQRNRLGRIPEAAVGLLDTADRQ